MIAFPGLKLERIRLDIPRIREVVGHLKFIHLSDLHISRFGQRERRLVRVVNREQPDLILMTGDLVVNYKNNFSACIQTLKRLKAKKGMFAVFGNSEHTFNPVRHLHDFRLALQSISVTLLNNKNHEMNFNGRSLYLVGVDDPFFRFDNFDKAVRGIPEGVPSILLAHSPDILFPRADALVINLLDSPLRKDRCQEWGWMDRTHYSPDTGDIYFQDEGTHTIRVQSRQVGVCVDTLLLNPYQEIDAFLRAKEFGRIDGLLASEEKLAQYPDLVVVPASQIDERRIFGKWKKEPDRSALFRFRLDDLPAQKQWVFQPLIHPRDYFEVDFEAKTGLKYHLWMRMKAYKGNPLNDSVYVQFSDAVDEQGRKRYRIGQPACSKERMSDMDLILTGHTHGGQVRVPFRGPVATMSATGDKYVSGMYGVGKSTLYVSRGVGCSALPIRLFC
ncbi:MAG: metallophosphoesterase, partial [Candidatus Aminicenantes bacterium]